MKIDWTLALGIGTILMVALMWITDLLDIDLGSKSRVGITVLYLVLLWRWTWECSSK